MKSTAKGIPCLQRHGDNINPNLASKFDANYPDDKVKDLSRATFVVYSHPHKLLISKHYHPLRVLFLMFKRRIVIHYRHIDIHNNAIIIIMTYEISVSY